MAEAKKCDKCGIMYSENNHSEAIEGNLVMKVKVSRSWIDTQSLDICDDCLFSLLMRFAGKIRAKKKK